MGLEPVEGVEAGEDLADTAEGKEKAVHQPPERVVAVERGGREREEGREEKRGEKKGSKI